VKTNQILKLVTAALLAAMTSVVTVILPITIPNGNGAYIHPGDAFVMLCGIVLGPLYGGFSAGIGSMLADLYLGAPQYFIATFFIKFLAAMTAAYTYRKFRFHSVILSGALGGIVVTVGYFIYEWFLYGNLAVPAFNSLFNLLQNAMGIVIASLLLPLLRKVPQIKSMMDQ
jgi:uncharacterized membrane protein